MPRRFSSLRAQSEPDAASRVDDTAAEQAREDEFLIAGTKVVIPVPDGYVRLTPDLEAVQAMVANTVPDDNELLAYYITDADADIARRGGVPELRQSCAVQISKLLKDKILGKDDFADVRTQVREENRRMTEEIKAAVGRQTEELGERMSGELDLEMAMKLNDIVPVEPHFETDAAISYSMYVTVQLATADGVDVESDCVAASLANPAGKVLYLYTSAPQDLADSTRAANTAWARAMLAENPDAPAASVGLGGGFSLERVAIAAAVGAAIGLGFALFRKWRG